MVAAVKRLVQLGYRNLVFKALLLRLSELSPVLKAMSCEQPEERRRLSEDVITFISRTTETALWMLTVSLPELRRLQIDQPELARNLATLNGDPRNEPARQHILGIAILIRNLAPEATSPQRQPDYRVIPERYTGAHVYGAIHQSGFWLKRYGDAGTIGNYELKPRLVDVLAVSWFINWHSEFGKGIRCSRK